MRPYAEKLIEEVKDLPTLPSVVMELNRALADDSVSMQGVISIIERDPPLTSKVLRLANSSYYGMSKHVRTLREAIFILGLNTIRSIAMAVSVGKLFRRDPGIGLDMEGIWSHSLCCAVTAKAMLRDRGTVIAEEGFICGLVHDIGKLVIAQGLPEETGRILEALRRNPGLAWRDVEEEVLGFTHAEVGALVVDKWNFPREYCEGIRGHHDCLLGDGGAGEKGDAPTGKDELALCICVANRIAKAVEGVGTGPAAGPGRDEDTALEILGIPEEERDGLIEGIRGEFEAVACSWDVG